MMVTGRSYIVYIVVDTQTIIAPLVDALNLTADVSWSMKHINRSYPTIDLLCRTLDNFQIEFYKLLKDTVEFLKSINGSFPHHRVRRGAINFVGTLANLLFWSSNSGRS